MRGKAAGCVGTRCSTVPMSAVPGMPRVALLAGTGDLQSSPCVGSASPKRIFLTLLCGMLHPYQCSSKVELQKPQPQFGTKFNLKKDAMDFRAGFQQQFSFPLVHTGFYLI